MRYLIFIIALFAALQTNAQNNIVYGAGINYTNGAPTFTPPVRTSRVAIDTITGRWYHFNTPGGWQLIGNTIEEIAGCTAPAYTPGKGDSKVVINNCSPQPELYFYNGSAWVLVGGGSVYAGEGIRIENDTIILDSLYVLRFRTGDTTDLDAGAVSWNAAEQTLDVVINQGAVTGQMFQEVLYFTKNQTGTQINDGTVVMAAGTTGNSGKILIAPAIADGSVNSEYILGLATQDLPNGAEGMVTHFGKVRGIQTNGANYGETWVDGDVLYCSATTPGYLTKVLPTAPNLKVPIAIVIHAHPSNGTLFVRPSHFPDLAQINDVQLSSPTNGQVLTYNSTLSRWENATPANQLQTLSTDGSAGNISISSGNTITLNVNDADASATNELQTLSVAANTATLSNSGGSVTIAGAGINTVGTAGTTITVTGTEVDGSTTNELQTLSTGTNTLTLSNGGGTVTVDTDPSTDVTGSGTVNTIPKFTSSQVLGNSLLTDNGTTLDYNIGNVSTGRFQVIGTNYPAIAVRHTTFPLVNNVSQSQIILSNGSSYFGANDLSVQLKNNFFPSSSRFSITMYDGAYKDFLQFENVTNRTLLGFDNSTQNRFFGSLYIGGNQLPAARLHVVGSGTSSSTWTAQFHNSAGNNNALMIRDDGRVGIGTNAPAGKLHVVGEGGTNNIGTFVNNSGNTIFQVRDDNYVGYRNLNSSFPTWFTSLTSPRVGLQIEQTLNTFSVNTTGVRFYTAMSNTAGICRFYELEGLFAPASGTATFKGLEITTTINQTGGANGDIIGFDYNPSFTNRNGRNFAALFRTGQVGIGTGTGTPDVSAALDVTSTTQGVLFPRMTTTQRNAIATPADGLVIYNTTDNKLQVRAGGAWVDLH